MYLNLLEKILQFLEELASLRIVTVSKRVVELLYQLLLFARKPRRNLQHKLDDVIAPHLRIARIILIRNTQAPQRDRITGLCAFLKRILLLAVDGGNLDLTAQSCLCECNRNAAGCIVAVALENIVLLNLEFDIEIAVGTAVSTGLALTSYR